MTSLWAITPYSRWWPSILYPTVKGSELVWLSQYLQFGLLQYLTLEQKPFNQLPVVSMLPSSLTGILVRRAHHHRLTVWTSDIERISARSALGSVTFITPGARRTLFGIGELLGILANVHSSRPPPPPLHSSRYTVICKYWVIGKSVLKPGETLRSLADSKRLLEETRAEMLEQRERSQSESELFFTKPCFETLSVLKRWTLGNLSTTSCNCVKKKNSKGLTRSDQYYYFNRHLDPFLNIQKFLPSIPFRHYPGFIIEKVKSKWLRPVWVRYQYVKLSLRHQTTYISDQPIYPSTLIIHSALRISRRISQSSLVEQAWGKRHYSDR